LAALQATYQAQAHMFVKLFNEMNEKSLEYMGRDEPETALEYLKKVLDTLEKIES
jgi:hypothetical protein